jgi:hypothetical protein
MRGAYQNTRANLAAGRAIENSTLVTIWLLLAICANVYKAHAPFSWRGSFGFIALSLFRPARQSETNFRQPASKFRYPGFRTFRRVASFALRNLYFTYELFIKNLCDGI